MSLPREIDDVPPGERDTELGETEDGHAPQRKPSAPAAPHKLGRFVVLGLLGQGGMGSVLRAYDATLDRQVAIKLMRAGGRSGQNRRMLREAQALARLSHPNVVQVYEVGELEGQLFIAMELIVGKTLQKWHAERHSWRECLDVYLQVGRGLAAAHAAGLIHRDFKPANCILDEAGRARVLDFGLVRYDGDDAGEHTEVDTVAPERAPEGPAQASPPARGKDEPDEPTAAQLQNALQERLTQTGAIMGTVAYMAPEQVRGGDVDARSDQFSFCVSLYEALFGQRPFTDTPMAELLLMAFGREVSPLPPPPGIRVPRWLVRALYRGLSAVPADRWPSMDALLAELARHRTRTWARWLSWSAAVVGVAWVLAGRSTTPEVDASCEGADHEIIAAWSDEHRQQVHAAIVATGLPYAEQTWSKIEPKLDSYAQELAAAEVAACEHRDDDGPHHRCLDARTRALHRTVFLLEDADARTVDEAAELVADLPAIERCAEAEATRELEPSRTPEQQQHVDGLRERLELARALARLGKLEEGLREVTPVVTEAVALDDPAFLAEAHLVEGFILLRDSQVERAEDRLEEAFRGALAHDAGKVALEAATSLAYLVGVKKAQSEAGLWLGSTAEALADRHDPRGLLEAEALTVIAQVLAVRGQYPEAEQRYRDALKTFASRVGGHHLALVVPLNGLGQVLRSQQQLDGARDHYEQALVIRIDQLGDRHPQTAYQRMSLGTVMMERSELAAADDQYQQALEVLAALPAQRELLADLHATLGMLRGKQGRAEEGEQELRLAIEHGEAVYGPRHPWLATGRLNLGANLYRRERYEPAAEQYELALSILEHNEPTRANDELRIKLLRNLGDTRKAQGRPDEVEPNYRRALELLERLGNAQGAEAAKLHSRIGELYLARGRFSEAVREHEAALAILEATPRPDRFFMAQTLFQAGRALHAAGRPELALSHVERALELGRAHAGEPGFDTDGLAEYSSLRAEIAEIAGRRRGRAP